MAVHAGAKFPTVLLLAWPQIFDDAHVIANVMQVESR